MPGQGEPVNYRVVRSDDAAEVRIDVSMDGVKVVVPEGEDVNVEALLEESADWVLEKRDRYAAYRDALPERRFEPGESFPVLGTDRTVEVAPVLWSHVDDDTIWLAQSEVHDSSIREALEQLYRRIARRHLTDRVDHFAAKLGVDYSQLQIRNQKTRWGSYSPRTGTLSLNWRLLMAPPDVIDYVIVHELAHAEHPNHGPRFWRLIEEHVPDYEAKNEWLKENSTQLTFGRPSSRA